MASRERLSVPASSPYSVLPVRVYRELVHEVPKATVVRLPRYLRLLDDIDSGRDVVSSEELAVAAGANAANVRRDLSHLDFHGVRGLGYSVSELRTRIHALMQRFLEDREPTLASRLLNDRSLSDEQLINFLCYALEFSPMEKQALLEAPGLAERGTRLCDVVQFALEARARGGGDDKWYH